MTVADALDDTLVSDLDLSRHVIASPQDAVEATIEKMTLAGYSCALVTDGGRLVGVFTQRDVLMKVVGEPDASIDRIAVACGSAGSFLAAARKVDCQLLVTGETTFHTCLEAKARGVAMVLTGHYASERFAVEQLAEVLSRQFPRSRTFASCRESDPLLWV